MGTKDRILDTSLTLFNEYGVGSISSLQIAGEMGISPGNLYYHFRGKDEILVVLVEQCEQVFAESARQFESSVSNFEQHRPFLNYLLKHVLHYRFIFQSLDLMSRESPALSRRLRALLRRVRDLIGDILLHLQSQQVITLTTEQRALLAENLLLLSISWLQYQALQAQQLSQPIEENEMIRLGVQRLKTLVEPYLTAEFV